MTSQFTVDPLVFKAAPAYRRVILIVGRTGQGDAEHVDALLRRAHAAVQAGHGAQLETSIAIWREAFRAVGINPSKHRPAVDALYRRTAGGHLVRTGVPLVDAGTTVSLTFGVPVGVHVLDELDGPLALRPATDGDTFTALNGEISPPDPGEIVWACGSIVLTRRWVWRQGRQGSVAEDGVPRSLAVNIDLIDGQDRGAIEEMTELLARCGFGVTDVVDLNDADMSDERLADGPSSATEIPTEPLLADLHHRGLIYDCTNPFELGEEMARGPITLYVGIDPTAPSLHVGSLLPLRTLQRFQQAGHQAIVVIGGATGAIGDPSGKKEGRVMLDRATLDANRAALRAQVQTLLPTRKEVAAPIIVDNLEWLGEQRMLDFLRDVGRFFPVGEMLARDSVKSRMRQNGISYTEFSYAVLQAFDFAELRRTRDCVLQVGGSDQWGNIVAGADFMRRRDDTRGYGLVWPLLTRADGEKFGKSAGGNVWLDERQTSAWQFWQFWLNTADADVETLLLRLSSRTRESIGELVDEARLAPEQRLAQRALADELTAWVHGELVLSVLHQVAEVLYGETQLDIDDASVCELLAAEIPTTSLGADRLATMDISSLAVSTTLVESRSAARRLITGGGMRVNGQVIDDPEFPLERLPGGARGTYLLQRGRRTHHLVTVA